MISEKSLNDLRKFHGLLYPKKNILKSASFDVMQTVFFAFTCKFGLVL